MGCVSSKHVRKEIEREQAASANLTRRHVTSHVVSLTSSTYGALKLDAGEATAAAAAAAIVKDCLVLAEQSNGGVTAACKQRSPPREEEQPPEVINTWELMQDLEEAVPTSRSTRECPKPRALSTPLKFLSNNTVSPRTGRRQSGGKENRGCFTGPKGNGPVKAEFTPSNAPLKSHSSCKAAIGMRIPHLWTPKRKSFEGDNGLPSRRNLGLLFDPDHTDSQEKELTVSRHAEHIGKIFSPSPKIKKLRNRSRESESLLSRYQKKCPPGGESSVVIYTTTLRGIRKTFEDCNIVRSVIESHLVRVLERDVSMDSGFREELRGLMENKEVKVPMVFVKGRMVGGTEEVVKLEEEGKLGILFDGIRRASNSGCEGCGGFRFVMCTDCNGSCKVLGEDRKKVKCEECNENGLIHCPICS